MASANSMTVGHANSRLTSNISRLKQRIGVMESVQSVRLSSSSIEKLFRPMHTAYAALLRIINVSPHNLTHLGLRTTDETWRNPPDNLRAAIDELEAVSRYVSFNLLSDDDIERPFPGFLDIISKGTCENKRSSNHRQAYGSVPDSNRGSFCPPNNEIGAQIPFNGQLPRQCNTSMPQGFQQVQMGRTNNVPLNAPVNEHTSSLPFNTAYHRQGSSSFGPISGQPSHGGHPIQNLPQGFPQATNGQTGNPSLFNTPVNDRNSSVPFNAMYGQAGSSSIRAVAEQASYSGTFMQAVPQRFSQVTNGQPNNNATFLGQHINSAQMQSAPQSFRQMLSRQTNNVPPRNDLFNYHASSINWNASVGAIAGQPASSGPPIQSQGFQQATNGQINNTPSTVTPSYNVYNLFNGSSVGQNIFNGASGGQHLNMNGVNMHQHLQSAPQMSQGDNNVLSPGNTSPEPMDYDMPDYVSKKNGNGIGQHIDTNGDEGGACCICLEAFVPGQKMRILKCSHVFHADCINDWLRRKNTCPLDRSVIIEGARSI